MRRSSECIRTQTIEHVLSLSPPAAASREGAAAIAHLAHCNRSLCLLKMGRPLDALRASEQVSFARSLLLGPRSLLLGLFRDATSTR